MNDDKYYEEAVKRFYNTGMQVADCLRLLGKHEESGEVERWVLSLVKELNDDEAGHTEV